MQYLDLEGLFRRAKNAEVGKVIANNTYVVKIGDDYGIKLYDTIIMRYSQNGNVVLNSGGYRTATTKQRINEYAHNFHIIQENGMWFVGGRGEPVLFEDNMVIPRHGVLENPDTMNLVIAKRNVDRMVSKYIKGYINDMMVNGIHQPGAGDCWCCLMTSTDNPNELEAMGYDHYLSHFEEKYYVPSIFYKAIKEKNYPNPDLILSMMSRRDFLKREGTLVLQKFFRKRKLGIVEAMGVRTRRKEIESNCLQQ